MIKRSFLLLLVISAVACSHRQAILQQGVLADSAMVVCAHPLASAVGIAIIQRGGNAVDAAIAMQFALAVVYPSAGNIGGGGFMVLRLLDGSTATLDYREKAPDSSRTNMYLDSLGDVIAGLSEIGPLSAGVPGTVAGLVDAHTRYGKLPWKELVEPAVALALHGIPLTEKEAAGLNSIQEKLRNYNTVLPQQFIRTPWTPGDTLYQEALGHTLERIRDNGRAGFYEGQTADDIVAEMKRGGGIITYADLKNYKTVWRDAITATYKEYKIIAMPPPSSGGVALIQLLRSVEPYDIKRSGFNTIETIHLQTEAERRVFADRAYYLGDPDFTAVPVSGLINTLYIHERMQSFNPHHATPSASVKEGMITRPESEQTTHLSIVDRDGNAVSVTTTLNDNYGSKVVVSGSGFLLNDEMDDFSTKPGAPNMYGAVGGQANKIEPGKRMLSSMTPTIVEKNGKLFMVVGTPGGTTIITSVFQTILNVIEHNMSMQQAVNAPRIHSQWLPDLIQVEAGTVDSTTVNALRKMGHQFGFREDIGRVDAILCLPGGTLEGGADPRGDDLAKGF